MEKQSTLMWIVYFFLKCVWSQSFIEAFLSFSRLGDKTQVPFVNKPTSKSVKPPYLILKSWGLAIGQCSIAFKITVLRSRKSLYLKTDCCFLFLKEAAFWKCFDYPLICGPFWVFPSFNLCLKPNIFHKLKQESAKKQTCLDSHLHSSHSECFLPSSQKFSLLPPVFSCSQWQTTLLSLMSPACFPHTSCLLGDDRNDRRVSFLFSGLHLCFTEDWQSEAFLSPSAEPRCLQASTKSSDTLATVWSYLVRVRLLRSPSYRL